MLSLPRRRFGCVGSVVRNGKFYVELPTVSRGMASLRTAAADVALCAWPRGTCHWGTPCPKCGTGDPQAQTSNQGAQRAPHVRPSLLAHSLSAHTARQSSPLARTQGLCARRVEFRGLWWLNPKSRDFGRNTAASRQGWDEAPLQAGVHTVSHLRRVAPCDMPPPPNTLVGRRRHLSMRQTSSA